MHLAQDAGAGRSRAGADLCSIELAEGSTLDPCPPAPTERRQERRSPARGRRTLPARSRWLEPPPPPDSDALPWSNLRTLERVLNALKSHHFGFLERAELATLRELVGFRNRHSGRCNPARATLAYAAGYKSVRTIDEALAMLIRSEAEGGHGLVVREMRRFRGVQSSSLYWFTERFYALIFAYEAELAARAHHVRQSAIFAPCRAQKPLPNGSSLSDPSLLSSSLDLSLGKGEPPRADAHEEEPPVVRLAEVDEPARLSLSACDAFAETFWPRRAAKYGGSPDGRRHGDELEIEQRIELGAEMRNLAARGRASAVNRGLDLDHDAIAAELHAELADVWLEHTGRKRDDADPGFLVMAQHPLSRLLGDLTWASERALLRWESRLAKRRPKRGTEALTTERRDLAPTGPRRVTVYHEDFAPVDFSQHAAKLLALGSGRADAVASVGTLESVAAALDDLGEPDVAEVAIDVGTAPPEGAAAALDDLDELDAGAVALEAGEVVLEDLGEPDVAEVAIDAGTAPPEGAAATEQPEAAELAEIAQARAEFMEIVRGRRSPLRTRGPRTWRG
jgi:hypothetical protein